MADTPAAKALRLLGERKRRELFFPAAYVGDPPWDALLWLFVETERGRRVSRQDLYDATRLSAAVGSRWLASLRQSGIVVPAFAEEIDDTLMLSDAGYSAMCGYLATVR